MQINSIRLGVFIGLFLAAAPAAWAVLVAMGWAQPLMNFGFWGPFIAMPYHVVPFELVWAAAPVSFVFVMGLVFGTGDGLLWNTPRH